jgi:hypothetical protein
VTARLLVVVLLALATLWVLPAPASACSCQPASDVEHAQGADVIFTGTVVDDQQGEPRTLTFRVERVYKGRTTTTQIVSSAGTTASCGLDISGAGPFLVYAQQEQTGLAASLCGGTGLGPVPADLGQGRPPEADPSRPGEGPATGAWIPVVGFVLAASAAGLVGWALIRRRPT